MERQKALTLRLEMQILSNPWIWLRRIRHRCGYGVHSPFAFQFLMQVVYERNTFYALESLDAQLAWWQRFRVRRHLHLLFRLANYVQPVRIVAPAPSLATRYMLAACPRTALSTPDREASPTLVYLLSPWDEPPSALFPMGENDVLVLDNLHRHAAWFATLPATVTFDLHDVGIAFFNHRLNTQHYVVNF
ncbi:MAG: hypothetical protein K5945_02245 [Bacteroidaceae bacterium]|nr:hypothetical protein [Bacteroidaceae bacterium]